MRVKITLEVCYGGEPIKTEVAYLERETLKQHNLQLYLHPLAERLLDWFHMVLRVRGLRQLAKGVAAKRAQQQRQEGQRNGAEEQTDWSDPGRQLERAQVSKRAH